jgi:hypothetical protein
VRNKKTPNITSTFRFIMAKQRERVLRLNIGPRSPSPQLNVEVSQ